MIEHFVRIACKFFYFINGETTEVTHLMAKMYVVFFITCFFGSMRGEHQALSYFLNVIVVFIVEIKRCRQAMRFVQMIYICFKPYLIKQFSPTYTQQNKLGDFSGYVCII